MRVLLLCDDYWHPGQIPIDGVAPLAGQGFQFDIITDAKNFKPDMLSNYPVVLMAKSDEISQQDKTSWKTETIQKAFITYVEKGGGLLVVHSGTVACKQTDALDILIGCRFVFHPNACPVTVQPIKPHPVTEGVGMFCETDEHYRLEILAKDADILIASYSPPQGEAEKYQEDPYHNTQAWICPAGYVRTQGKGRICVLTPGHLLPVWQNLQYQRTIMKRLCFVSSEVSCIVLMKHRGDSPFPYPMSKASLNMGVRILHNQLYPQTYTFRLFHPGWMKRRMQDGSLSKEALYDPDYIGDIAAKYFEAPLHDEHRLVMVDYSGYEWTF